MGKRGDFGLWVVGILLLCSFPVLADHSSNISIAPLSQYETTSQQYDVNINNLNSKDVITQMTASIPGFEITGAVGYGGWQSDFIGNSITWYGGTVETNVINALFQFLAKAPVVDADTTYDVTVNTIDSKNFTQVHKFTLTIKNDATPPVLGGTILPQDNSYVLQGSNLNAFISASDPETGIKSVQLAWNKCNSVNATTTLPLTCTNDNCTGIMALSSFANDDQICFTYTATNNGNAATAYSGKLTIDGEAPGVTLIAPADNAEMNSNSQFRFLATDNLAPTLNCDFNIDGAAQAVITAANGNTTNVTVADAAEGTHTWSVACRDQVGLSAASAQRTYILDKTPPTVTANKTNNSIIKEGSLLPFITTDNNNVASVQFRFGNTTIDGTTNTSINTSGMQEGKKTIEVIAADNAGNVADVIYTYFIDKTPPVFGSITSPGNTSDVNASFTFTVTDNLDPTLLCLVFVDNKVQKNQEVGTGIESTIIALIAPGTHSWYLQCADDAENTAQSPAMTVNVTDTSGPFITISPIGTKARGTAFTLATEVIDYSGVNFVDGYVMSPSDDQIPLSFTKNGTNYTALFESAVSMPLGVYNLIIHSQDNLGYNSTGNLTFTLVRGYTITLSLDPAASKISEDVTLHGIIRKDDGSVVNGSFVSIQYLGNTSNVSLDAAGSFAFPFIAPEEEGDYELSATYTDPDGIIVTQSIILTAVKPKPVPEDNGGGDTRGKSSSSSRIGFAGSTAPSAAPAGSASTAATSTQPSAPSVTSGIEARPSASSQAPASGTSATVPNPGVGQAVGFFSLENLKNQRFWWSLLGILALIITLVLLGRKGHLDKEPEPKPADPYGWDRYLEELAKKRP